MPPIENPASDTTMPYSNSVPPTRTHPSDPESNNNAEFQPLVAPIAQAPIIPQFLPNDHAFPPNNNIPLPFGMPFQSPMMSGALPIITGDGFDVEHHEPHRADAIERPATAASGETYHQAQTLFHDFDGTHYTPTDTHIPDRSSVWPVPRPRIPPPAPGMVFYPAPVPSNLNLPPRLSKATPAHVEAKRRTEVLSTIDLTSRRSAPWLNHERSASSGDLLSGPSNIPRRPDILRVPPQLRASVFFDRSNKSQEVEIKDQSAVRTLEDMLDAAATAPVSAFTDHMFTGGSGDRIYRREVIPKKEASVSMLDLTKQKRSSSFLGIRRSSINSEMALTDNVKSKSGFFSRTFSLGNKLDNPKAVSEPITPMAGAAAEEDGSVSGDEEFSLTDDDEYYNNGPPTTLLAELQIRKEEQAKRKKTALSSFPNGMHSTLLELDAVAQIQKRKRQNARVTLAWERSEDVHTKPVGDDEDVPLGVLFSDNGKVKDQMNERGMADWDRPLGLIALRERDDTEPLAARRLRLRSTNPYLAQESNPMIYIDDAEESEDDDPEETLAQRRQRLANLEAAQADEGNADLDESLAQTKLRLQKQSSERPRDMPTKEGASSRPISKAFTDELLGEFGIEGEGDKTHTDELNFIDPDLIGAESPPEEEETLGQRRARLQKLAQTQTKTLPNLNQRNSMLPQARPGLPRASTSLADLLGTLNPHNIVNRVTDQQLVSSLPADSLLAQAENVKNFRKEAINQGMYQTRSPSGLGGPLLNINEVDQRRNSSLSFYNAGPAASMAALNNIPDVRQSIYGMPAQAQSQMTIGMGMGMPAAMPMQQQAYSNPLLEQAQLLNYQTAQMANMMSMTMGLTMPVVQPPMMGMGMGMNNFGSTPNLLAGGAGPGMSPYMMQQPMQSPGLMGPPAPMMSPPIISPPMMTGQAQGVGLGAMPDGFIDDGKKQRIDQWRMSVQMEP